MQFETQAEIYQALLAGKKIRKIKFAPAWWVQLVNGMTVSQLGLPTAWRFEDPSEWEIWDRVIDVKLVPHECFYEIMSGNMIELEVNSPEHTLALKNPRLSRVRSRDYVKRVPIYQEDTDETTYHSGPSGSSNSIQQRLEGQIGEPPVIQESQINPHWDS